MVVVQVVDVTNGTKPLSFDHHQQVRTALESILEQIDASAPLQTPAAEAAKISGVLLPRCILKHDNDVVLATGLSASKATLIDLRCAGQLSETWPPNAVVTDQNTIYALIERYVRTDKDLSDQHILDYLASEAETIDIDAMRDELADIYRLDYATAPNSGPQRTMPQVIRRIIGLRLRMSDLKNLVAISGSCRIWYEKSLAQNIAELDSLALVSVNSLLYDLQLQLSKSREIRQLESDRQESRDRRIAQLVAAFVLPALWFAFLATSVVPEQVYGLNMRSAIPLSGALLISVVLACSGWFLVNRIRGGKDPNT